MPERSALNQVVQVAIETAPGSGTAVSGSNFARFNTIGIEPSPKTTIDQYRPAGSKYKGFTALGQEWTSASVSGRPSYNEIVFALASVINKPTAITMPTGTVNAKGYQFRSDNSADDTPKTFIIEHGSSIRAERFNYGIFVEAGFQFSRQSIAMSGSMIGRQLQDDIGGFSTLASSQPTMVPVQPTQVSVFVANQFANFATDAIYGVDAAHGSTSLQAGTATAGTPPVTVVGEGRLVRLISTEWSLGSRFAPFYTLDSISGVGSYAQSFAGVIESEPDLTVSMTMEADGEGMGFLGHLRRGDTKFVRIEANGPSLDSSVTGGTTGYKFRLDTATRTIDTGGFRDQDGLYAVEWSAAGFNDPTWGRALQAQVWNSLPTATGLGAALLA